MANAKNKIIINDNCTVNCKIWLLSEHGKPTFNRPGHVMWWWLMRKHVRWTDHLGMPKVSKIICLMHLSMLCPWGRGSGKGWGFDIFLKIFDKIHSLGTKSLVKNHKNPHPGADPSTLHNTTHALISITDSVPCPTWWITITAYPMHLFNITY